MKIWASEWIVETVNNRLSDLHTERAVADPHLPISIAELNEGSSVESETILECTAPGTSSYIESICHGLHRFLFQNHIHTVDVAPNRYPGIPKPMRLYLRIEGFDRIVRSHRWVPHNTSIESTQPALRVEIPFEEISESFLLVGPSSAENRHAADKLPPAPGGCDDVNVPAEFDSGFPAHRLHPLTDILHGMKKTGQMQRCISKNLHNSRVDALMGVRHHCPGEVVNLVESADLGFQVTQTLSVVRTGLTPYHRRYWQGETP